MIISQLDCQIKYNTAKAPSNLLLNLHIKGTG